MAYLLHAHTGLKFCVNNANAVLQNALKIFEHMPKSLMDIVKKTDPSTVTQHGLYMRPLTDPSLHPLVAKAPAAAPDTPPNGEEQKTGFPAAPDSPETVVTATVKELVKHSEDSEQTPDQATNRDDADAVPSSPVNAPALHVTAGKQSDATADVDFPSNAEVPGPSAETKDPSLSVGTPSVSKGNLKGSVDSSSTPVRPFPPAKNPPAAKDSPSAAAPDTSTGSYACLGKGAEPDSPTGWGRGRVSLLGDAAHATIPNGAWLP